MLITQSATGTNSESAVIDPLQTLALLLCGLLRRQSLPLRDLPMSLFLFPALPVALCLNRPPSLLLGALLLALLLQPDSLGFAFDLTLPFLGFPARLGFLLLPLLPRLLALTYHLVAFFGVDAGKTGPEHSPPRIAGGTDPDPPVPGQHLVKHDRLVLNSTKVTRRVIPHEPSLKLNSATLSTTTNGAPA
ncbi:hypothetical protein [Amycolatopsis sp. NBC_01480]|uniref:hypothetical protein n=1 Tax=Amycolatopsis sp. NBC_01480 TaxID=2903562 RepID=UPI002E2B480C|nr:hypothetical protein [Amycolatopsis sp. NBC_01480]